MLRQWQSYSSFVATQCQNMMSKIQSCCRPFYKLLVKPASGYYYWLQELLVCQYWLQELLVCQNRQRVSAWQRGYSTRLINMLQGVHLHFTSPSSPKAGTFTSCTCSTQAEMKNMNHSWGTIQRLASDRQGWRRFVAALHASRRDG